MSVGLFYIVSIFIFAFVGLIVGLVAWMKNAKIWVWGTLVLVALGITFQITTGQLVMMLTPLHLVTYFLVRKHGGAKKEVSFDYLSHVIALREQGAISALEFESVKARIVRRDD